MELHQGRGRTFGMMSLVVLSVFFVNVLAIPVLTTRGMAAAGAGAAGAGAAAGTGTAAGVTTGTIAAGVAVAAAAAMAIATSGGSDNTLAAASAASQAGSTLAAQDPTAASQVAAAMGTLSTTALSTLATANTDLGSAGQASLATAAGTMDATQFANYLATGGNGAYAVGSAQYTALQSLSSYTPAQLQALQSTYSAAYQDGQVNTATLQGISGVITTAGTGTPEQMAENLRQAQLAILTARHPGYTVTVTTVNHGNNVYTTVSHVSR